tara:strand:- start:62 stop:292 length:231 start_codon:yes stop_codon:yes gene_type:complete
MTSMRITLDRIKNIAEDIIADDEWVNDSHTKAEHSGIKAGLYSLIHHLEEVDTNLDDDNFVLTHSFGTLKDMGGLE